MLPGASFIVTIFCNVSDIGGGMRCINRVPFYSFNPAYSSTRLFVLISVRDPQ